ncbi:MAG: T9SS type A sorting domain-containing protein [Bacteroidetes bacterium]|nr:T9SS type A sorting domain-containing protein [Bacteroidota bacterium]
MGFVVIFSKRKKSNCYEISDVELKNDNKIEPYFNIKSYPNPVNGICQISYSIPNDGIVKVFINNSIGQIIKIIDQSFKHAVKHQFGLNMNSEASGVYFVNIIINGSQMKSIKIILMK